MTANILKMTLFAFFLTGVSCKQSHFVTGELAVGNPYIAVEAPDDASIHHLSWPKLVKTNNGTLILAYSAGVGHNRGGSGPAVSISTDNGATFSKPNILAYFPDDDNRYRDSGNQAIGLAEDGSVILLAMAFRGLNSGVGYWDPGHDQNTIFGWRSVDDGITWTRINTDNIAENKTGSVFGEIINVPGKGLVVFGHYRQPSIPPHGIWMSTSVDGGKTWGPPETVIATTPEQSRLNEPSVIYTEERFVGLFRNNRDPEHRRYELAISDDLGATWEIKPSDIIIPWQYGGRLPGPCIKVSPHDPSKLYAIQAIRGEKDNTLGRMYLWTAEVNELKWSNIGMIAGINIKAEHLRDWSYPWMVHLEENRWLVVFYAGLGGTGANSIHAITIEIDK